MKLIDTVFDFTAKYLNEQRAFLVGKDIMRLSSAYPEKEIFEAMRDFDQTRGQFERCEAAAIVRRIEDTRERKRVPTSPLLLENHQDCSGFVQFMDEELKKEGFSGTAEFALSHKLSGREKNILIKNIERAYNERPMTGEYINEY